MQTKAAKIILIIFCAIVLGFVFYFIFFGNQKQLTVKTTAGTISINNPYQIPNKKPLSLNGVAFKESSDYSMDYYPQDQGFIIIIQNPNIQAARDAAEKEFIATLGISQTDVCKLKVSLTVPFDVSENAAGGNYHLSFCPDGKPFPANP